jgi:predicted phage terminase large subunit-like protein
VPGYFPVAPSKFHAWLVPRLSDFHRTRGQRLNVLAPRGAAKSTWSTFAYPLYLAIHGIEPYIILTSDTGDQAHKYLDAIRAELETNELLRTDYAHLSGRGAIWREDRIRLANGVMIEAIGTGTKLRGRKNRSHRPSLIIVDDPQNTGHILSALQRERSWEWLVKDVSNAGSPITNIIALGTALHRDCIVCRLHSPKDGAGWTSHLFTSVISWPKRMDLWREWEQFLLDHDDDDRQANAKAFYLANQKAMDAGAEVVWPERDSLYALMLLRVSIGVTAFASERQNDPTNPEACEWPPEYFDHAAFWFDAWPDNLVMKAIALDPSKGKDAKHGDYSAFVYGGTDKNGVLWLDADLQRRDTSKIVSDGLALCDRFHPHAWGSEVDQFQELLCIEIAREMKKRPRPVAVYGIPTGNVAKMMRVRRLGPYLSQRKLRVKSRSPGAALLVQQLRDFPNGDHDDGPDALEMLERLLRHLLTKGENEAGGGAPRLIT